MMVGRVSKETTVESFGHELGKPSSSQVLSDATTYARVDTTSGVSGGVVPTPGIAWLEMSWVRSKVYGPVYGSQP